MRYFLLVAVLIAVLASVILLAPRESRHASSGKHPAAPTAAEEGGMPATGTAPAQANEESGQATTAAKLRAVAHPQRAAAPRVDALAVPSPPVLLPVSGARGPNGNRDIRGSENRVGRPSSDEHQAGEEPIVPPNGAVRAAGLTAPVLLTPVAGYPAEGYRVKVDRSILTAQMRVEAAQGKVVLKILVRSDGSVGQVRIVESSGSPVLDDAAARAAAQWMFTPATLDGQPVEAWAMIPIRFVVP